MMNIFFPIFLILVTSCIHIHEKPARSFWQKADSLTSSPETVFEDLKNQGDFEFEIIIGKRIFLNGGLESVIGDLYFSKTQNPAPLVVFSHGNKSFKEAHRTQAERFASWGFNVANLQFPSRKRWVKNGKLLSEFVGEITSKSRWLGHAFDRGKVFVVGHSFGGSAASIAASKQSKISGLILLDPAVVHTSVIKNLSNVKVPVFLLGADRKRYKARKRDYFFKGVRGKFLELSIAGSTHNDAQYPSMTQIFALGYDPSVSGIYQERFLTIGLIAAFDLAMGKQMAFAKRVYQKISRFKNMVKNLKWHDKVRRNKG